MGQWFQTLPGVVRQAQVLRLLPGASSQRFHHAPAATREAKGPKGCASHSCRHRAYQPLALIGPWITCGYPRWKYMT